MLERNRVAVLNSLSIFSSQLLVELRENISTHSE